MRHMVTWRGPEVTDREPVERAVEGLARQIGRRLSTSGQREDEAVLHAAVESPPAGQAEGRAFHVALMLSMPGGVISADAESPKVEEAFRDARHLALAQLAQRLAELRREARAQQRERTRRDLSRVTDTLETYRREGRRDRFLDRLGPYLKFLYRTARHMLRMHRAAGDLPTGELTPSDLVDEVAAWAFDNWESLPRDGAMETALQQKLREILDREIEAVNHEPVHIEQDPPRDEERYLVEDDEQVSYFEKDQALAWEDVLPDEHEAPAEAIEGDELNRRVLEAVSGLPRERRDAFIYHVVAGYSVDEVSRLTGREREAVARDIEQVREALRQQLR